MWIDEVVDDVAKVHERLSSSETAEASPHRFDAVLDFPVVSFNVVVVILEASNLCLDRDTET